MKQIYDLYLRGKLRYTLSGRRTLLLMSVCLTALISVWAVRTQFSKFSISDQDQFAGIAVQADVSGLKEEYSIAIRNKQVQQSQQLAMMPAPCLSGQIGGIVFRDFQNDGIIGVDDQRWDPEELPNTLLVTAYDDNNAIVGVAPVDALGQWSMAVSPPVRLELSGVPDGYEESFLGADNGSSVAFATVADCNYNFAINNPVDYREADPRIVLGCFALGGAPWTSGNTSPLVNSWPYGVRVSSSNGRAVNTGQGVGVTPHTLDITYGQIGHIWGVETQYRTQSVFFSALASPTWAAGPLGIGGIYLADYSGPNNSFVGLSQFLDVTTLGVDLSGDGIRVGEYGLGAITLSEDEETLYAVNIGQKELIVLPVGIPPVAPVAVSTIPIGDPGCSGGNWRPFALKEYRGKLYVGGVCDASGGNAADLQMIVQVYDPANPGDGWNIVLSEGMDWNIGRIHGGPFPWVPWSGSDNVNQPQPILQDIAFDIDGSMILGFHARMRFHSLDDQPTGIFLRAHKNANATYTMELDGVSGPYTTNAFNHNSPPVAGRDVGGLNTTFFFSNNCCQHGATASGGVGVVPGTGQVITGQADPVSYGTFGLVYHDAIDGSGDYGHILGSVKAAVVTDPGIVSDPAVPEIGNRIWVDVDADGIQDPSESGLGGVAVNLFSEDGTLLASTTTGPDGQYHFNQDSDGNPLPYDTPLYLEVPADQTALVTANFRYKISPADYAGNTGTTDRHDNDGILTSSIDGGGDPVYQINLTTGGPGEASHQFDFGLEPIPMDYNDLPDTYVNTFLENGPSHGIPATVEVYLGAGVEEDPDGQPDVQALGDEDDGVVLPAMLFQGETAVFEITVVNDSDEDAKLVAFVDWDNDGDFDQPEEMASPASLIPANSGESTIPLSFPVPLAAVSGTSLGAQFRISTDPDFIANMSPEGFVDDGEVEGYLVSVKPLDFGDLPDDYLVSYEDDGPRHGLAVEPVVYLGELVDEEADGPNDPNAEGDDNSAQADEDGVQLPSMFFRGEEAVVILTATNLSDDPAKIVGWIDFNNDATFQSGEMVAADALLPAGSDGVEVILTFSVPVDAVYYELLGARFRISTDPVFITEMRPSGFAMDGEVEDYLVEIKPLDFGDLPPAYPITTYADNGARHGIPEEELLFIGTSVDEELEGIASISAGEEDGGDDGDGDDDEDGVVEPAMIFQGEEAAFTVSITNNTGQTAKVVGFADWNNNGQFDTDPEFGEIAVGEAGAGTTEVSLSFQVPLDAVVYTALGARFRVSTDPALMDDMSPDGFLMDGEVEDYVVEVKPLDFGDLPEDYLSLYDEDGPRHGLPESPAVFFGMLVDMDGDGQEDFQAEGDDNDEADDEDGVALPPMLFQGETATFTLTATNNTEETAKIVGWVDWNADNTFDNATEMVFTTLEGMLANEPIELTFDVPLDAVPATDLGARFRISTDGDFMMDMSSEGFAMDGEVEDYLVRVKPLDFGDLPDLFIVNYDEDGPRHGLPELPLVYIGGGVDQDPDGQPSPSAGEENDGDDGDGSDDEDGVTKPDEIFRGEQATFLVDVVNNSPNQAKLVGFVDWNRDLDFEDENEMEFVLIDPGTIDQVEIVFDVPQDAGFYFPFTGARFRISTDPQFFTDEGMSANGFLMDGEVEDCLVEVSPVEYGDLPISYGTLLEDDGARHGEVAEADLYLGDEIDQDFDGQPDGMDMALGDDEDEGDDDDGVEFLTPLMPGDTAKVRVDVTIVEPTDAYLNAWIDFDGNGVMNAGDALEIFAIDDIPIVPTSNLAVEDGSYVLCFLVPEDAVFAPGGMAYARFRLSSEGNLAPTGFTMDGEVEDYKVQLAKIGNLVWRDYNYNGIQDNDEPGIETPVAIMLVYAGEDGVFETEDDFTHPDTTDENGLYYFCGLIEDAESMYKLIFTSDFFPTLTNVEDEGDDKDSDGEVTSDTTVAVMFLLDDIGALPTGESGINDDPNDQGNFPDAVTDQSLDQGYAGFDYGDLPDEYLTSDDSYNDEGTRHVYFPGKYLGSCIDLDLDGQPSEYGDGDDNNEGVYTEGECEETGDDENGITFLTPLIPGYTAKVEITYTNTSGEEPENAYLNGWIDWNGDAVLDAADKITFTLVDEVTVNSENLPLMPGEAVTIVACFEVPADALFRDGNAYARFRLGCEQDMPSFGTILGGEVEDYVVPLAKVGNLAWYDNDLDGVQGGTAGIPQELGVPGVEFILTYAGYDDTVFGDDNDFEYTTTTTGEGLYNFCGLIKGKYMLEVQKYNNDEDDPDHETPEHYILTVPDLGDSDNLDSDFTPALMIMIPDLLENDLVIGEDGYGDAPGEEGFPDEQDDLSLDAGWIPEPNVESLLNIAGVDFGPDPKECDQFNIIVDVCIKNTGYVEEEGILVGAPLAQLSAVLDLQAEMGDAFVGLDGAPELLVELGYDNTVLMSMPDEDRTPGINPDYDGSANAELLDGSGLLYPGENICIRLNVTIDPMLVSMMEAMAIDLQAKVKGLAVNYQGIAIPDYFNGGAQFMAMDLSDDDWNFTGGYHDPDDAEAFGNCFKDVDPVTVYDQLNIAANADCGVCIDPSEVVAGYEEACGEDVYPLGGFYRLTVEGIAEDATEICLNGEDIVDGKFVFSIRTVTQRCYPTWGEVLLEDKTLPTLTCPHDIAEVNYKPLVCADVETIFLDGTQSYVVDKNGQIIEITDELKAILDLTGYALAEDNCAGLTVYINDELIEDEACDDQTIKRTFWIQAEVQGVVETETCMQLITFTKPHLADVAEPKDVELPCTADLELDKYGNPHPNETGYPVVITGMGTYDLAQAFCNLGASYKDGERIVVCDGTYKVVRTWEVLDWCAEGYQRVLEFDQIIKIVDDKGPKVACAEVDYDNDGHADLRTFSTGPYDCTASFEVPMPEVSDACSSWSVLTEILTEGEVVAVIPVGASRYVSGIPVGCHEIRYIVTDDCGNKTVEHCPFQVLDQVAPIAVCDDDLNISLGGQSFARVTAEDIDEGSSDNCKSIYLEVRRRIDNIDDYACLDMFDYDGDGEVIGDEITQSTEAGNAAGDKFYYTPWEPYVDFNCCDMGEMVRIELRVWDDANGSGIFGDEIDIPVCYDYAVQTVKDNHNVCWLDVLIEDKVPPVCTPPLAAEIDCDKLPYDFDPQNEEQMTDLFGEAEGFDNCGNYTVEELQADTTGLNDCGSGYFIRRFRVTDAKGIESAVCQQVVTVHQIHDYWIKFPADAEANCGTPMVDTILTSEGACDLLAINVKEEIFSASGDECYKIFRTYSVINWCEYDGQSDPVVVSRDEDCDGVPGDESVYVIVQTKKKTDPCHDDYYGGQPAHSYEHVWYDRDSDPFNSVPLAGTKHETCDYTTNPLGFWKEVVPVTENEDPDKDGYPANGRNRCDEMASVGYWQYTQVIKVYDNVKPEILYTEPEPFCTYSSDQYHGCPAEVNIEFQVDENCTPEDVTVSVQLDKNSDGILDGDVSDLITANYPDYHFSGSFPIGKHTLEVKVSDGCGNTTGVEIPFEVADCKAPTPICINGLAIELMPVIPAADADGDGDTDSGAMTIWASDFIASPSVDCSGEVTYSINRTGEEVIADQTGLTLTCDDNPTALIEIWAWDAAGNGDYCETYILVQDNMVNCVGGGTVAGVITTEETEAVEGVTVELSGGQFQSMATQTDGHYTFEALATGFDYTVTPQYDAQPLNGVSTFDLVLMSKHILGIQPMDSPYKRIAADVNNDKKITAQDAILLRRLILNIDVSFGFNTSWRFIPRDYVFPDSENPWSTAFPEVINVNNLQADQMEEDFIAVKIGDLDLSAKPNALTSESRDVKGLFLLDVQDQDLKAGNTYQVDFRTDQLPDIQGYQLTLSLDRTGIELAGIDYGIAAEDNFGLTFIEEGLIATSWNKRGDVGGDSYDKDDILFSLTLKAITDTKLSGVVGVSSRITVAEAYDEHDGLMDVGIDFHTGTIAKVPFELYQNVPNPFREETVIGFYLPEASETTLRIHDAGGRVIKVINGAFTQGQNRVILKRSELADTGILYYTLTAGEHIATRKMILVK
ncbi:MAG: GEVED domain-containing protein [Saprospiraceae bacterium]